MEVWRVPDAQLSAQSSSTWDTYNGKYFHKNSFAHVYRERNSKVDVLSKEGIQLPKGTLEIVETHSGVDTVIHHTPFL